ncbi:unnamed protein product [Trichobilharzia regenti]|nr:unnamed protein product [Trichobilharzia regenti]
MITDAQCPGLTPQEMDQCVCTADRLAECLSSHLIHLRDRWITSGSGSGATVSTTTTTTTPTKPSANDVNMNDDDDGNVAENRRLKKDKEENSTKSRHIASSQQQSSSEEVNTTAASSASVSSTNTATTGGGCLVKEYLLRKRTASDDFVDVRVAVVGNVDAGKSTLLGVLTHGELDNGRGLARLRLLRHKHEAETGRTSSVAHDILGFNSIGQVVNKPMHGHLNWSEICEASAKVSLESTNLPDK